MEELLTKIDKRLAFVLILYLGGMLIIGGTFLWEMHLLNVNIDRQAAKTINIINEGLSE